MPGERVGVSLGPITPVREDTRRVYKHVVLAWDPQAHLATITVKGPSAADVELAASGGAAIHAAGDQVWALRAMRELDDALLWLRVNLLDIGLVLLHTKNNPTTILTHNNTL